MSQACRIAILNCEDKEKWNSSPRLTLKNVSGHINRFVELFVESFGEDSDHWEAFSCCNYHWPSVEEAKLFDAIYITGSGYSVYDDEVKWIPELRNMIQLYMQEDIRVVGICFGAQLLSQALGGKVGRNPGRYVARIEDIHVLPELSNFIGDVKTLGMIESHGDQVIELPPGAVLLGQSSSCKNEIWCVKSALAIQGHPEFHPDLLLKIILPSFKRSKVLSTMDVIHSGRNLRNKTTDHQVVIDLIKRFSRSDELVKSQKYQDLFPCTPNTFTDKALIQQINTLTVGLADLPYAGAEGEFRNPVDQASRNLVQNSVNVLTDQFSTLMLKELKRTMIDFQGLENGNTVILEDAKGLLSQTLDLYKPIRQLRSDRLMLTEEINQVVNEVTVIMTSLEESARLLERETNHLKQSILQ